MGGRGPAPDVISYNAALSACAEGQSWELSLLLLEELRGVRLAPDEVTFGSAIRALGERWELAAELLREAREARCASHL